MRLSRRNGQSIAEYAVLVGLVLWAIIVMQNYIRQRLQGALAKGADDYQTQIGSGLSNPTRDSTSTSSSAMTMTNASQGTVGSASRGTSTLDTP